MKNIVLGIGGSSGSVYARILLEQLTDLKDQFDDLAIVMSDNARINWNLENPGYAVEQYGFEIYGKRDFMAPFASGSAQYDTMVICPASMGVIARIANGLSDDLMTRAADVILKERRKLIVVPRETPLSLIHLENMVKITRAGGIVCPATPSFYSQPTQIEDLVRTVTDRVIDLIGLRHAMYRWGQPLKG